MPSSVPVYIPFVSTVQGVVNTTLRPVADSRKRRFDPCSVVGTIADMIAMMKDSEGREMVDVRTAAKRYDCSMTYIRRLAREGRIGSELVAGSYMVCLPQVLELAGRKAKGRHKKRSAGFRPD